MSKKTMVQTRRNTILRKFLSLVDEKELYEWKGYYIDKCEGNLDLTISTDFKKVLITITRKGAVYVVMNEVSHTDMVIRLAEEIEGNDKKQRTLEEIIDNVETIISVFEGHDFHHYMFVMNGLSSNKEYCFDYFEWLDAHNYYMDMERGFTEDE